MIRSVSETQPSTYFITYSCAFKHCVSTVKKEVILHLASIMFCFYKNLLSCNKSPVMKYFIALTQRGVFFINITNKSETN